MIQTIKTSFTDSILLIAGEHAHFRYFIEDAYKAAADPKELMIIPNANHVDLYDKVNVIPFDKLEKFFTYNLKQKSTPKPVAELEESK